MLENLRIGTKILIVTAASLVVVIVVLTASNLARMDRVARHAEEAELRGHLTAIRNGIAAETRLSEALSAVVAGIPDVRAAFARGDRDRLIELLLPPFEVMRSRYGVRQLQFHTPPATSFVRIHKLQKFGDDLSSFRHTVVQTNETQQPTRGLEKGVAGLGARGMVPVSHDERHLGSLEFGMSFGQPFFDAFAAEHGVDAALYVIGESGFEPFASTLEAGFLTGDQLHAALDGTPQLDHFTTDDGPRAVYADIVRDFSGRPVGVVEIAMDNSTYVDTLAHTRQGAALIAGLALLLGAGLAYLTARSIARRLQQVVDATRRVAAGDLSCPVGVHGRDEVGTLAGALNDMRDQLLEVVSEVRDDADTVSTSSREIASGSSDLARRTQQQAAALEQTAASLEELSATVCQNADNASRANELAADARRRAEESGTIVREAVAGMHQINESSRRIQQIISVIDEISFKTNLLSLNAATEAVRAGEHGRGFAVVAREVRSLAQRSADSAREIKVLIRTSVDQIGDGTRRVDDSGEALTTIIASVQEVSSIVAEIAVACREQSAALA